MSTIGQRIINNALVEHGGADNEGVTQMLDDLMEFCRVENIDFDICLGLAISRFNQRHKKPRQPLGVLVFQEALALPVFGERKGR